MKRLFPLLLFLGIALAPGGGWAQISGPEETRPSPPPSPVPSVPPPQEEKESFWKDKFIFSGVLRQETAFRVGSSPNFSKIRQYAEMDFKFLFNDTIHLKFGGRGWYDAAYDVTDHYPKDVDDQMRTELTLRDAYLDIFGKNLQARLGHQQVVWGEALVQFFADVVNPQDLREFILPSFDFIRLPIWAVDLRWFFLPNATFELVASPDQTVDKIALPGADFSFYPNPDETFFLNPLIPGITTTLLSDKKPQTSIKNWNGGGRITYLTGGWDLSWLFYTTSSHIPMVFKTLAIDLQTGQPTLLLNPVHPRTYDFGFTFSKDLKKNVLRGEFVYTHGRMFNSNDVLFQQGLVGAELFRYVLGFDTTLGGKVDMISEFQQQVILNNDDMISDPAVDSWLALRFETGLLDEKLVPELIFSVGLRRGDTMIRPRINFFVTDAILLSWGADIFTGPGNTLFGQFDGSSRLYMNTQWSF